MCSQPYNTAEGIKVDVCKILIEAAASYSGNKKPSFVYINGHYYFSV